MDAQNRVLTIDSRTASDIAAMVAAGEKLRTGQITMDDFRKAQQVAAVGVHSCAVFFGMQGAAQ